MKKLFLILTLSVFLVSCRHSANSEIPVSVDCDRNYTAVNDINICSGGNTVFFSLGEFLLCADKTSLVSAPLCAKPECLHGDVDCNAYYSMSIFLSLYDGKLFWLQPSLDMNYEYNIVCTSPNGTDRKVIRSINDKVFTEFINGAGNPFGFFHRDYLLMGGTNGYIEAGIAQTSAQILVYPIGSGEGKLVYENLELDCVTAQAYGDYLYFVAYNEFDSEKVEICRYDLIKDSLETLYSGDKPFNKPLIWVVDDGIILADRSGATNIYKLSFDSSSLDVLYRFNDNEEYEYIMYGFAQGCVIGGYSEGTKFRLCLKDFDGHIILKSVFGIPQVSEGEPLINFPCGSDEEFLYVWSNVWSNENPAEYIFAVSLDDGSVKTLWSAEY